MSVDKIETLMLDKMLAVKEESQIIGEFLNWLTNEKNVSLMQYDIINERYVCIMENNEKLLAKYFDVDLDAAEKEKQEILKSIRNKK